LMPATINGIGTTYYGKKNLKRYLAVCEHCRREVEMQDYETVYWFVVVYIPVIPLGRKQILNYCTRCRRHHAASLAKWEELKEQSIAAHTAALAQNQDDPKASLELLGALTAFNRLDEADRLATGIQSGFDDRPEVQLALGQWYDS